MNTYSPKGGYCIIARERHRTDKGNVVCDPKLNNASRDITKEESKCKVCYPVEDLTFKPLPKQNTLF